VGVRILADGLLRVTDIFRLQQRRFEEKEGKKKKGGGEERRRSRVCSTFISSKGGEKK